MECRSGPDSHPARDRCGSVRACAEECEVVQRPNEPHDLPVGVLLRAQGVGDRGTAVGGMFTLKVIGSTWSSGLRARRAVGGDGFRCGGTRARSTTSRLGRPNAKPTVPGARTTSCAACGRDVSARGLSATRSARGFGQRVRRWAWLDCER